jgi:hypothetical protein
MKKDDFKQLLCAWIPQYWGYWDSSIQDFGWYYTRYLIRWSNIRGSILMQWLYEKVCHRNEPDLNLHPRPSLWYGWTRHQNELSLLFRETIRRSIDVLLSLHQISKTLLNHVAAHSHFRLTTGIWNQFMTIEKVSEKLQFSLLNQMTDETGRQHPEIIKRSVLYRWSMRWVLVSRTLLCIIIKRTKYFSRDTIDRWSIGTCNARINRDRYILASLFSNISFLLIRDEIRSCGWPYYYLFLSH